MKAMIFAAGLGTRLKPLTDAKPKALVEVGGFPLLEIALQRLIMAGCDNIIVNVHHFADQMEAYIANRNPEAARIIISDERNQLLDTGGGLKKAAWFFDDGKPFFVYNADILTNLDLKKLYASHLERGALATLAVQQRNSSRALLFNKAMLLHGWTNLTTGEVRSARHTDLPLDPWSFSGIHVIDPKIFDQEPDQDIFSMIDWYLALAGKENIRGYNHNEDILLDVGKPGAIEEAESLFGKLGIK